MTEKYTPNFAAAQNEAAEARKPSYNELVRALAFTLAFIERYGKKDVRPNDAAQLEVARKLLKASL